MKTNPPYLLIAVIFFLVILYSTMVSSKSSFMPYSSNSLFPRSHPYEGFQSKYNGLGYSSNPQQQPIDSYSSYLISNPDTKCNKVFGFSGLYCKPDVVDNHIDIFSEAQGSLTCQGSGLTNSKGSLCLDKNMMNMLTSRGGNSTGRDSQIGH